MHIHMHVGSDVCWQKTSNRDDRVVRRLGCNAANDCPVLTARCNMMSMLHAMMFKLRGCLPHAMPGCLTIKALER